MSGAWSLLCELSTGLSTGRTPTRAYMPTRATRTRNAYAHTMRARDPPPIREASSAFALGQNDVNRGLWFLSEIA
jgi:hypothetical protein